MKIREISLIGLLAFTSILTSCEEKDTRDPFSKPEETVDDVKMLTDGDLDSYYTSNKGEVEVSFKPSSKIYAIDITASELSSSFDPIHVEVSSSTDGTSWKSVAEYNKGDLKFLSRFHTVRLFLDTAVDSPNIKVEISSTQNKDIAISEVAIVSDAKESNWSNFPVPTINFTDNDSHTNGSKYYNILVQQPSQFIAHHALIVAQQLYFSAEDLIESTTLNTINYNLKDYDGVSAKSGAPPIINIDFSTRHVESSYTKSLFNLSYETRGVLYHELTHGYQAGDPKGIPGYNEDNVAWAAIEGLADAVRINLGYTSLERRAAGGTYMGGYTTTGFFIQWLTTKDIDAIRKFNSSFRDLPLWSFDGAMQYIFEDDKITTNELWTEYQTFLNN